MVVEFLTFSVAPDDLSQWLEVEREVWTRYLETVPGFVRKEIWTEQEGTVHAVIWWESSEAWQAVTPEQVAAVDARMGAWYREPTMREFAVIG